MDYVETSVSHRHNCMSNDDFKALEVGKDHSGTSGNSVSKLDCSRDELIEQYGQLQYQLRQLKQRYHDIFTSVVLNTSTEYLRCKSHFILRRKHEIKRMIEGCVEDSVMLKFPQQPNTESDHEETKPAKGLLAAAMQYLETTEEVKMIAEIQREVKHLNTEDLQRQIRITNTALLEIKRKFETLYQELISLREGYEASNQMLNSFRRYLARKRMLKAFIARNTNGSLGTPTPLSRI